MKTGVLPDSFLRCLPADERKRLGQRTAEEVLRNGVVTSEKQLQTQIVQLLRLKGIEPLVPTFGKATRIKAGWPDITFCVNQSFGGCAWEVKIGDGKLSDEQKQMAVRLMSPPNGWRYAVVRSIDDALAILKELGVEKE
jgi:hypothetical protein